jgi:hypothetical protein
MEAGRIARYDEKRQKGKEIGVETADVAGVEERSTWFLWE